jgi:plasmid stabilization system protein ParE
MGSVPAKPLEWTRAALDQLEEQLEYVAAKGLANPVRVGERIERALDLIRAHPLIGTPGRRAGTREWLVGGSPLTLIYRVERIRILILAVMHQRQSVLI